MVQAGRVKLHEFHVDHTATRTPCHRNAITRIAVGIGRNFINLTRAACGNHGELGFDGFDFARVDILQIHAVATRVFAFLLNRAGVFVGNQIHRNVVLKHLDIVALAHALCQSGLHRMTCEIIHVHHAAVAVSAFAREVKFTMLKIELDPLAHQPFNRIGRVGDDVFDGLEFAQLRPCDKGIAHMVVKMIIVVHHRRDAALGIVGRTADECAFGNQRDFVFRIQRQGAAHAR